MSDRLRLTTNTALDTLFSSKMYCQGVSSNIQTQFNNITSNSIFFQVYLILYALLIQMYILKLIHFLMEHMHILME